MCWTTYTRQYRISVRRLMSLHMFVVNVIVAFFLIIFFIFLLALCRVVPDPEAILLCQGPGMSMRTMCMRIWIHVRTGTHTNIYMCICIYLQDFWEPGWLGVFSASYCPIKTAARSYTAVSDPPHSPVNRMLIPCPLANSLVSIKLLLWPVLPSDILRTPVKNTRRM